MLQKSDSPFKIIGVFSILIWLVSCSNPYSNQASTQQVIKTVKARPSIVPLNQVSQLILKKITPSKNGVKRAGKPDIFPVKLNTNLAKEPVAIQINEAQLVHNKPGTGIFKKPIVVPAKGEIVAVGTPEIVLAKDRVGKDQNPDNFSSFGKLQGLKNNVITAIIQDHQGNLWFGTKGSGVTRYDGKYFTHYSEQQGLLGTSILSMLEDHNGNLWFGTDGGGLIQYNGRNFIYFNSTNGLAGDEITSISEDHHGNIWLGYWGNGLSKYDGKNFTHFKKSEGLGSDSTLCVFADHNNAIWIGSLGAGVTRFDGTSFTRFTQKEGLIQNDVSAIAEDNQGGIWFGTGEGISQYKNHSFSNYTAEQGFITQAISCITQMKNGDLWFGTLGDGAIKFDGQTITHFTEEFGLSHNDVLSIFEDNTGNIWLGTDGGGVSKYNGKIFTQFTNTLNSGITDKKNTLKFSDVFGIIEPENNSFWLATLGNGIIHYNRKNFQLYGKNEGLSDDRIYCILKDRKSRVWIGTNGTGLCQFDGINFTNYTVNDGLPGNNITCLLEDRKGNIWLGTRSGVAKYSADMLTTFTEKEGLVNNYVYSIQEDREGNIWFGTSGGVSKYNGKQFTNWTEESGLINNAVTSILVENSGCLWFGTLGGACRFDGNSFFYFTEKEGLANNAVLSMLQDQKGNIWMGTRFGLSKISKATIKSISTNKRKNKSFFSFSPSTALFKNYTYEDGFQGIGCWRNSILEAKDGTIYIGANDRLMIYHPNGDVEPVSPPKINLVAVSLFNESLPWSELQEHKDSLIVLNNGVKVSNYHFTGLSGWNHLPENLILKYNNNSIGFTFVGITQHQPEKIKYQYKLEGFDEAWSTLTPKNDASYANLSAGHYQFKVKALSSSGVWSQELAYPFSIRPPWWKTTLAYVIYLLGFLGSILGIFYWRSAALRRENRILEEKVLHRTMELQQKSSELELSLDHLKSAQTQLIQAEKLASLGELTAGIAHEIQNPLNFVNNFAEINQELLSELEEEIEKGNLFEIKDLAKNLKVNEGKINHHGQRASAIVRAMLEHSRNSTGVKEPTDLNSLADEYLRLAYHGLRAKDSTIVATIETHFDPELPKITVIPQDIGRVILNLINNAFYAVTEKAKKGMEGYRPTVIISTQRMVNAIEIRVTDNGNGIPDAIKDKIFQPFFTTKPTGQGTGLGLSLSYDIVTKGHGGTLVAVNNAGEGATFLLQLPLNNQVNEVI